MFKKKQSRPTAKSMGNEKLTASAKIIKIF